MNFRLSEKNIPLIFIFVTLIAYGLFVPLTGFYWDDWVFSWIAKFLGPAEFLPAFIGIRPFLIPIFFTTTSLVPPVPVYWQILALIIRILAGLSAWFLLKRVWPGFKGQMLVASLLFLVFPAYSQHWVAYTHINQEWVAFILYLLSMGLTISALRNPQKFKSYTTISLILFFEGLFATEYFFGMEPLRFLFIWVVISEDKRDLKDGMIRALKVWLPYLIIWLINGFWLAWYYGLGYNSYDLKIIDDPESQANVFYSVVEVIWKAGLYAWAQVLVLTTKTVSAPSSILTLILIGLSFIVLLPILKKVAAYLPVSKRTYIQFILIGLLGIVLGRVPSFAAGLPFRLQSSFDRFAISMMLGGCLFILGLVEWLIKNPRVKIHVYALLIALSIGQQFFNGNIFRRDWERQQEIFWQMKWRMPSLQPNTVILTDEIAVDYESDGSFIGPINWIYDPDFKRGNLHYLVLYTDNRLGKSLRSLEPHTDIQFRLRTVVFYGSTSQAVVIHMPENGCLRVLDPELGDHETYEKKLGNVVDAIHLTDTKRILPKELEPPDFLSTPERDWCYYYTKAELARQFKHWEQILLLQNEAGKNGFVSDDPFEWLPFIEANAMTSNLQTAHKLSKEALDADPRIRIGLCKVWERVQAANAGESDEETLILTALSDFKCLP